MKIVMIVVPESRHLRQTTVSPCQVLNLTSVTNYNEHNASARGVKMITISRAERGNSITEPTAQQEVLLVI